MTPLLIKKENKCTTNLAVSWQVTYIRCPQYFHGMPNNGDILSFQNRTLRLTQIRDVLRQTLPGCLAYIPFSFKDLRVERCYGYGFAMALRIMMFVLGCAKPYPWTCRSREHHKYHGFAGPYRRPTPLKFGLSHTRDAWSSCH